MAKDGMTKPRGGLLLKMCWPDGEDSMSSGPRTVIDVSICGVDAAPKVIYVNESGGVMPL